jgi:hypothetical protein
MSNVVCEYTMDICVRTSTREEDFDVTMFVTPGAGELD